MGGFENMVSKKMFKYSIHTVLKKKIGRRHIKLEIRLPVLLVIIKKMVINLFHTH